MTYSNIPLKRSPIESRAQALNARFLEVAGWAVAEAYGSADQEAAAARSSVVLVDRSAAGKLLVEGAGAEPVIRSVFPPDAERPGGALAGTAIGAGQAAGAARLFRLRSDRYFVGTRPGGEPELRDLLEKAASSIGGLTSVVDMTHGWAELWLVGPASAELLSRLCGLDFAARAFPDLAARQSSVAKTSQLIVRNDLGELPAYGLIGPRSLAGYLWDTILEAGRDLKATPAGQAALNLLR